MNEAATIKRVLGRQVWNSAGLPTLEIEVTLAGQLQGRAIAAIGMSGGDGEYALSNSLCAMALKKVRQAIEVVNGPVNAELDGYCALAQQDIDQLLQGFCDKKRLSSAHTVTISIAVLNAAAACVAKPVWRYLSERNGQSCLPVPLIELFGGGAHANHASDVQDIAVICPGAESYQQALLYSAEVYHCVRAEVARRGYPIGVCEKGGLWPGYKTTEEAFEICSKALEVTGLKIGSEVGLAVDFAADEYSSNGLYQLSGHAASQTSEQMVAIMSQWLQAYPLMSIEDPLSSTDSCGLTALMADFGDKVQIVGDDILDANMTDIIANGIQSSGSLCNTMMLKPAKIGTVSGIIQLRDIARESNFGVVMSGRSVDSEDTSIMQLTVGLGVGQLKVGSIARSERGCKFNEGIRIAETLGEKARYGVAEKFWRL